MEQTSTQNIAIAQSKRRKRWLNRDRLTAILLLSPSVADRQLATSLERSGARVWAWPELAINHPDNDASLSEAINNLFGYDWLILKNAHAADYFLRRFLTEHQPEELEGLRVLTIGPEAAERASELRVHVDIALNRFSNAKLFPSGSCSVGVACPTSAHTSIKCD